MTRTDRTARLRSIAAADRDAAVRAVRLAVRIQARGALDPRVVAIAKCNGHLVELLKVMSPAQKAATSAAWMQRRAA